MEVALLGSIFDPIEIRIYSFQCTMSDVTIVDLVDSSIIILYWGGGLVIAHLLESVT